MKPARFDYLRAASLSEACDALAAEAAEAAILAGGQTLVPLLSMRMARPRLLIDIMHLPELGRIDADGDAIRVGASVRQAALLERHDLPQRLPLLAMALPFVGHAQTRARGTVCGSAALADPSAEIPLVLVALQGEIELVSGAGRRRIAAADFFTGPMTTARCDDELIEAVRFPCRRAGQGFAFREFARRHGDFAIVACAAVADDGATRLAVGGVADRPVVREFGTADGRDLDDALAAFADGLDARDDLHADAHFRRRLVRQLGRQCIEEARRCRA